MNDDEDRWLRDHWLHCDACHSHWTADLPTGLDRDCPCREPVWDDHGTVGRGNRNRRAEVARRTGKCRYCRPHSGENRGRRARGDKGKRRRSAPTVEAVFT